MSEVKKITKVEKQKYNKERYSIFLNDEYGFSVSEDVLIEYNLLKGKELESNFIDSVLISEEKSKAKSVALRFLGYKMRSEKEVRDKLGELGYDDYSDQVVDYLLENKYLDDKEYAISFAREKMNLKGFGMIRIKMDLQQKGINSNLIDLALEEIDYLDNEYDIAYNLAEKRMNRTYKDENDRYRKIYSYLIRRGYTNDLVKKILDRLLLKA